MKEFQKGELVYADNEYGFFTIIDIFVSWPFTHYLLTNSAKNIWVVSSQIVRVDS